MNTKESNESIEAKYEGPSDDWSRTSEGIKGCVRFPKYTPIEVIELYRSLDFQRRELEKQRTYAQDNLLRKQGRKVFMNSVHEADDGKKERLADSLMEDANRYTDVLIEELEGNSKQRTNVLSRRKRH